ncbi:MAG: AarF/UbiB family protein, partial [Bacillota bacterium]
FTGDHPLCNAHRGGHGHADCGADDTHGDVHGRSHGAGVALDMSMRQVFEMGAFHADPHPGNLLVVGTDRLAIFDFGMVGLIDRESIGELADLFLAIIERQYGFLTEILLEVGSPRKDLDARELRRELMELVEHNYAKDLRDFNLGQVLVSMMQILRHHRIAMPASYIGLVRALVSAESSARLIYPDFRLVEEMKPRIRSVLAGRWGLKDLQRGAPVIARRVLRRLSHWTGRLGSLVDRADRGEISIMFHHVGLETFQRGLEKIAQRITLSVLIASLIIGGSLIIQFDRPPYLLGYPALGMVSYIGALILGAILVSLGRR